MQLRTPDLQEQDSESQLPHFSPGSGSGLAEEQAVNRSENLSVIISRAEAELDDDVDAADNRIYAFLALNVVLAFGSMSASFSW
jgi:hypothetical protein